MKKLLAAILALVMALSLCSVSWAAVSQSVNSAAGLKTAIETGGEIILSGSFEVSEPLSVSTVVTINLNGQTITGKNGASGCRVFNVVAGGSLTLTGSGTITTEASNDGVFTEDSSVIRVGDNTNGAECGLVVGENVKIIAPASYGIAVFGKNTKQTLEVSGTVTAKEASAISGNGTHGYTATEITINDGANITSENNVAIYHPQAGTLTVKAANIIGSGGIEIKSGTANVNVAGVNIKATGDVSHSANNNGTSSRGYAIAVVENPGYIGKPSAVIENGVFVGAMGILKDGAVSNAEKQGSLAISAGSFTVDVNDYVTGNTAAAKVVKDGVTTYAVGSAAIADAANSGAEVTVTKAGEISGIAGGKTVKVAANVTGVKVNGNTVEAGGSYTVPTSTGGGYYYAGPSITAVLNGPNKSATDYTSGDYGLIFRSTASYSGFTGVQVDGKALAKGNYTVEDNGGTEVYLKAAYLKTLAAGKHTVTILSTAGNVSMDFTIGGKTTAPQTFDAGIALYVGMALTSAAGVAFVGKKRED